jgi:hypothetical protein
MLNLLLGEAPDNLRSITDFFCPNGGTLLDISYGNGSLVQNLLPHWKVIGLDLNGAPAHVLGTWDTLPFKEESVDAVLFDPPYLIDRTSHVLYNRPDTSWQKRHSLAGPYVDYDPPLKEAFRVLKSGGICIVKTQNCRVKGKLHENDHFARSAMFGAGFDLREIVIYARLAIGVFRNKRTPQQAYGFYIIGEKT